jgi:DNA-binding transcriptional LysR family regulator
MNDGDAILAACIAGEGIAQFPITIIKTGLANGQLVLVLPELNPDPTPLSLVWPRKRHLMPGIRYIIDEFVKYAENQLFD